MHWPYTILMNGALPPTYDEENPVHKSLYTTAAICDMSIATCDCDTPCEVCEKCREFIRRVDTYFLAIALLGEGDDKEIDLFEEIIHKNVQIMKILCIS